MVEIVLYSLWIITDSAIYSRVVTQILNISIDSKQGLQIKCCRMWNIKTEKLTIKKAWEWDLIFLFETYNTTTKKQS